MQKMWRRGERQRALDLAIEIHLMGLAAVDSAINSASGSDKSSSSKRIVTNLITRLLVGFVEDCADPASLPAFLRHARVLASERYSRAAMHALVEMVELLAGARKGRMVSIMKLYMPQHRDSHHPDFARRYGPSLLPPQSSPPSTSVQALLRAGDERAAALLTIEDGQDCGKVRAMLAPHLDRRLLEPLLALEDLLPRGNQERHYFALYGVALATVFRSEATAAATATTAAAAATTAAAAFDLYSAACERFAASPSPSPSQQQLLLLPDYCYDVHTAQGRAAGKTSADFAREGAHVENMHPTVARLTRDKNWEDMYLCARGALPGQPPQSQQKKKKRAAAENDEERTPQEPKKQKKQQEQQEIECRTKGMPSRPSLLPTARLSDFSDFVQLQRVTTGTGRPMTFSALHGPSNERVVLKQVSDFMQNGLHCLVADRCKTALSGMLRLDVQLVQMNAASITCISGEDKAYQLRASDRSNAFLKMRFLGGGILSGGSSSSSRRSALLGSAALRKEYLRIGMYRYVLGVTDFNTRNVVLHGGALYSIDENSMGSRGFVYADAREHALRGLVGTIIRGSDGPALVAQAYREVIAAPLVERARQVMHELAGNPVMQQLARGLEHEQIPKMERAMAGLRERLSIELGVDV